MLESTTAEAGCARFLALTGNELKQHGSQNKQSCLIGQRQLQHPAVQADRRIARLGHQPGPLPFFGRAAAIEPEVQRLGGAAHREPGGVSQMATRRQVMRDYLQHRQLAVDSLIKTTSDPLGGMRG